MSFSITKLIASFPRDVWHWTEQVTGCLDLQTPQEFDFKLYFTSLAVQLPSNTGERLSNKELVTSAYLQLRAHFVYRCITISLSLLVYGIADFRFHLLCFQKSWASDDFIHFT